MANSPDWLKSAPMQENLLAAWRQSGQNQDHCPSLLNHIAKYKRLLPPCCDFANGVRSFSGSPWRAVQKLAPQGLLNAVLFLDTVFVRDWVGANAPGAPYAASSSAPVPRRSSLVGVGPGVCRARFRRCWIAHQPVEVRPRPQHEVVAIRCVLAVIALACALPEPVAHLARLHAHRWPQRSRRVQHVNLLTAR